MAKHNDWYGETFKAWPKQAGNKPTEVMLKTVHAFGRPGKQSMALAMAMRPEGVTASQVLLALSAPQNNHRVKVLRQGYFKQVPASKTAANHTVYKVELTAKGKAKADRAAAAPEVTDAEVTKGNGGKVKAKPVKKARKAKVKVNVPADMPAPVSDGADTAPPVDTGAVS